MHLVGHVHSRGHAMPGIPGGCTSTELTVGHVAHRAFATKGAEGKCRGDQPGEQQLWRWLSTAVCGAGAAPGMRDAREVEGCAGHWGFYTGHSPARGQPHSGCCTACELPAPPATLQPCAQGQRSHGAGRCFEKGTNPWQAPRAAAPGLLVLDGRSLYVTLHPLCAPRLRPLPTLTTQRRSLSSELY